VPGAITIDPGVVSGVSNPVDDSRFFITQQYADLTGREVDATIVDKLTAQLSVCAGRSDCLRARRVDIATNLVETELSSTGVFLYGIYSATLGRMPRFTEFETDRASLKGDVESARMAFAGAFVDRAEFKRKYPASMKPVEFVDSIISLFVQTTGVDLGADRSSLITLLDENGRAAVLARLMTDARVVDAHYNHALVMVQYFTHLRRNPDEAGYAAWVNTLKSKPLRDPEATRAIVCNFLNSAEYQNRFGMVATHHNRECN